jgi:flagellar hook-associated protein 3 FlgL
MPRIDAISTRFMSQLPRSAIAEGQKQLAEAQTEAATGRHADMGMALGSRIGATIGFRLRLESVSNTLDLAKQADLRTEITQASLSTLSDLAKGFQSALAGARGAENGKTLASTSGMLSLDAMQSTLSTTYDGQYIFGGLMSDSTPLTPYLAGPRQAVIGAFETHFGFPPSDPAAAALSAGDIEGFLDGAFSILFEDTDWRSTWSAASSEGMQFRLGTGPAIDLQTTTDRPFARTLAQAFSMVEMLGNSSIGKDAFQAVADRAMARISEAQQQIGSEQARIGAGQARLKLASEALEKERTDFNSAIRSLEGVDAYEAATRINVLMAQLETSYAVTGRINRLSLLSYI